MTQTVFILEDDADVAAIIVRALTDHGYRVERFARRGAFVRAVESQPPSIGLIDLCLPDGDGLAIVGTVLQRLGVPSIIVTVRGDLADRVAGLELGADDYLVKPFEPRELIARVRSVLRRAEAKGADGQGAGGRRRAAFDGWVADFDACALTHPCGESVPLSHAEARLLRAFVESSGRVLSRAALLDLENPDDIEPFDRSMDVRVSRLRKKLGDDSRNPKVIKTVYGAGYVFAPPVEWLV